MSSESREIGFRSCARVWPTRVFVVRMDRLVVACSACLCLRFGPFRVFVLAVRTRDFEGTIEGDDRASNRPGVGWSFSSSDCCRLRSWLFGRIAFPLRRDRMLFLRVCKYIHVVGGLVRNPILEDTESRTVRGGGWKRTGLSDNGRTARSYRLRKVADEIRASFCRWFAAA